MNRRTAQEEEDLITSRIGNSYLAKAIHESVTIALEYRPIIGLAAETVWDVLEKSLNKTIFDFKKTKEVHCF